MQSKGFVGRFLGNRFTKTKGLSLSTMDTLGHTALSDLSCALQDVLKPPCPHPGMTTPMSPNTVE